MKELLSFVKKRFRWFVSLLVYLAGLFIVLTISWYMNGRTTDYFEPLKNQITISVFTAGLIALMFSSVSEIIKYRTEEKSKITDKHHDIIDFYQHYKYQIDHKEPHTIQEEIIDGSVLYINQVATKKVSWKKPNKPFEKLSSSDKQKALYNGEEGKQRILFIPSITILNNTNQSLEGFQFSVLDQPQKFYSLPPCIANNITSMFKAHAHSMTENNRTIRLSNIKVENGIISFLTERTCYFHMLLTNRCMDYQNDDLISNRRLFEFGPRIHTLEESELANQIGINGLILTSDGCLLIEKRTYRKSTWKNKFAQPISLAFKEKDVCSSYHQHIDLSSFEKTIQTTLAKNYGKNLKDCYTFSFKDNFLGLERDLLEGGKPNFYFYLQLDINANQFKQLIQENIRSGEIKKEKLFSDLYLVPFHEIALDYGYKLKIKNRKDKYIPRRLDPIFKPFSRWRHALTHLFQKDLWRECGEALLTSLSYLEICQNRIDSLQGKGVKENA